MLRWLGYTVLTLAVVGAIAYYFLIVESHMPSSGSYAIDMAEVRRLADSIPGDKATEVRVETVAHFTFPKTAGVAGDGWDSADMPVSSYQLVFPASTAIIDTALDAATGKAAGITSFDADAYARMSAALTAASLIVVTHEHMDHLAGLVTDKNLPQLLKAARLTKEQIDHPERMSPAVWPKGALDGYAPLTYDRYAAVAPGVVAIKAPGHTPGSQIVYVRLADGREILFLGDVAWKNRNIEAQRGRALLVSWLFLGEDRDSVMLQLKELKRLHEAEPQLEMLPGHDEVALDRFVSAGLLVKGFK